MNIYLQYGSAYVPFRLVAGVAAGEHSSIGGAPPFGVVPRRPNRHTRYLATLGLEGEVAVSIFTSLDYKLRQGPQDFFQSVYRLHGPDSDVIEFVVHPQKVIRDERSTWRSVIPACGLRYERKGGDPACQTIDDWGQPEIYANHKLGGQPHFKQLEGDMAGVLKLMQKGYVHLFQLAGPSRDDAFLDVKWPFGKYVFHLFIKKTGPDFSFYAIWG